MIVFGSLFPEKLSAGIIPSLCRSELALHSDSTDASAWGDYGLALVALGDSRAGWVLQKSLYFGESPEALRGLASLAVQAGEYQQAIQLLSRDSTDFLAHIMLCSVLQESGDCISANSVLSEFCQSAELPDAVNLLRIRQYRCEGNAAGADSLALLSMESIESEVSCLIKLDYFLAGNSAATLTSEEILTSIKVDLSLTGSTYSRQILSTLTSENMEYIHPYQTVRILALANDIENAERILSTMPVSEMKLEELVFYTHLLIQLGRLNEAESAIHKGMEHFPNSPDLLEERGILLLRGGHCQEAYNTMSEAVELTGSPECIALMGLAAEFAGEFILAVDAFSPLLEMSADSIVLINRTRNFFRQDQLELLASSTSRTNNWTAEDSGLGGDFSVSFYKSTGEYAQENVSLGGSIRYRYGLYNSRLSGSVYYSDNDWPGAATNLQTFGTSGSWRNYMSRHIFQDLNVSLEYSRDETRRWKLETIASCGYSFSIGQDISITPSAGLGRLINHWDGEMYQRDSYVYNPCITMVYSGLIANSFNPSISLSSDASCDFSDSKHYEMTSRISINGALNSHLSLAYSYDIDYQSIVPPENESQLNSSTKASLYFHF